MHLGSTNNTGTSQALVTHSATTTTTTVLHNEEQVVFSLYKLSFFRGEAVRKQWKHAASRCVIHWVINAGQILSVLKKIYPIHQFGWGVQGGVLRRLSMGLRRVASVFKWISLLWPCLITAGHCHQRDRDGERENEGKGAERKMEKMRGRESEMKTELTGGREKERGNNYEPGRLTTCNACVRREQLSGWWTKKKESKTKIKVFCATTWPEVTPGSRITLFFSLCQEDVGLSKLLFLRDVNLYNFLKSDFLFFFYCYWYLFYP